MIRDKPVHIEDGPGILDSVLSLFDDRRIDFPLELEHARNSHPLIEITSVRKLEKDEAEQLQVAHKIPSLHFEIKARLYRSEFKEIRFLYSTKTRKGVILEIY